ncbi:ABC transporter ATP-binding protein [Catenovulum agarivorans]|uniref:ABC transporter ATP-binding protein n=1 Tax=Catenovulum agarivorans TaxID=1172192 RepID=UPI0009E1C07B|nr:ABC transporter ATP-binding protein [Catenovulum agarivorans]
MPLIFNFLKYLRYHKRNLSYVVLFLILESLAGILTPLLAGKFSAAMLDGLHFFGLQYSEIAILWIALFFIQAIFRFISTYRSNFVGAEVLTDLSCRLYDHIQHLPISYFAENKKGATLSLLSNDAAIVANFLTGVITTSIPIVLIGGGCLILMASINITVTLLIAAMVPVFFLLVKLLARYLKPLSENVLERQSSAMAIASENISSIQLIKAFAREQYESAKYRNNAYALQSLRQKQLKTQAVLSPLVQFLFSAGILVTVLVCAIGYKQGLITIPELVTLLMYGLLFSRPVSALANMYGQTIQALAAMRRIDNIFAIEKEYAQDEDNDELVDVSDIANFDIRLENLTFAFSPQQKLYSQVNLSVPYKTTIIIKGNNGTGKSTLLNLLLRFLQPTNGNIYVGDTNINVASLPSLRRCIGYVPQNVSLCDGSIFENICYGLPQASMEQVIQASIEAGAHDFIQQLPEQYQTRVGEGGTKLSGGQKQKIALARALLLKPKILLLDEPTSMLDEHSRQLYVQKLAKIFQQYTVIMVTHANEFDNLAKVIYRIHEQKLLVEVDNSA